MKRTYHHDAQGRKYKDYGLSSTVTRYLKDGSEGKDCRMMDGYFTESGVSA